MANRSTSSTKTFGKPFKKKGSKGKFRKGTWIRYKYVNGRRVGAERSRRK